MGAYQCILLLAEGGPVGLCSLLQKLQRIAGILKLSPGCQCVARVDQGVHSQVAILLCHLETVQWVIIPAFSNTIGSPCSLLGKRRVTPGGTLQQPAPATVLLLVLFCLQQACPPLHCNCRPIENWPPAATTRQDQNGPLTCPQWSVAAAEPLCTLPSQIVSISLVCI